MRIIDRLTSMLGMSIITEGGLRFLIRHGEAVIIGVNKKSIIKEIPSHIRGVPVGVASYCVNMHFDGTLTFPNTVHTLCDMAFGGADGIKSVFIGRDIRNFGECVFMECGNLTDVFIDDGVDISSAIGMFTVCRRLKNVHLPEDTKRLPNMIFANCEGIEEIFIPDNTQLIGEHAFNGCKSLKSVYLPEKLKVIGACAFAGCSSLRKIELPQGLERIGEYAFCECKNLCNVIIPDTVRYIGKWAFSGCEMLAMPKIPRGCEVHRNAFGKRNISAGS